MSGGYVLSSGYTQRAALGKVVTVFLFGVVPDLRHL